MLTIFPILDLDSTCGSAVPTFRDPVRIRIPITNILKKTSYFCEWCDMNFNFCLLQLELRNDPESGLPIRKTIKFGTNCDLSDEKKWKPQIQVSSLIISSPSNFYILLFIPLCRHTFSLFVYVFFSCFLCLFSPALFFLSRSYFFLFSFPFLSVAD